MIDVAVSCRPAGLKPTETIAFAIFAWWRLAFSEKCQKNSCYSVNGMAFRVFRKQFGRTQVELSQRSGYSDRVIMLDDLPNARLE